MLRNIGFQEIAILLAVCLLIFGPRKLPAIGKAFGQTITEFKKSISGVNAEIPEASKKPGD